MHYFSFHLWIIASNRKQANRFFVGVSGAKKSLNYVFSQHNLELDITSSSLSGKFVSL